MTKQTKKKRLIAEDVLHLYAQGERDFRNTNLDGTYFVGADLRGADFSYASLRGADLSNANLTNTDFTGADLTGANLSNTNLTYISIYGADLSDAIITIGNMDVIIKGSVEQIEGERNGQKNKKANRKRTFE